MQAYVFLSCCVDWAKVQAGTNFGISPTASSTLIRPKDIKDSGVVRGSSHIAIDYRRASLTSGELGLIEVSG